MSKHTPGPWHPGHLGSDGSCQCANVVDEGYAGGICTIHIGNGKPISDGGNDAPPREEAIANMHLIAAAPDMLAALKAAVEISDRTLPQHAFGRTVENQAVYDQCAAAIAKAEARHP